MPLRSASKAPESLDIRLVQWSFLRRLMNDRQRLLYDYWLAGSSDGCFDISTFDPLLVWDCVGFLHILQYDRSRDDLFYRLSGDISAKAMGRSLHKRWIKDHPAPARDKFRAHYLDVMELGQPWLGEVYAVNSKGIAPYWNRMVLPLVDLEDPNGFVCLSLAEPHARLPEPARACISDAP